MSGTILVAGTGIAAVAAVMTRVDVMAMGPAVVKVGITFLAGIGGRSIVGIGVGIVAAVVARVGGTIGQSGLKLLYLEMELGEFGILHSELLKKGLIGGLEAEQHVTVG